VFSDTARHGEAVSWSVTNDWEIRMKATVLIAAGLLAFGGAAIANTAQTAKNDDTRVEQKDHRTAGEKIRGAMHRLGEKTRHALHRDKSDTRAMGAGRADDDTAGARQRRMDDAYANWQSKHDKQEQSR
jgi:hypothetical protein